MPHDFVKKNIRLEELQAAVRSVIGYLEDYKNSPIWPGNNKALKTAKKDLAKTAKSKIQSIYENKTFYEYTPNRTVVAPVIQTSLGNVLSLKDTTLIERVQAEAVVDAIVKIIRELQSENIKLESAAGIVHKSASQLRREKGYSTFFSNVVTAFSRHSGLHTTTEDCISKLNRINSILGRPKEKRALEVPVAPVKAKIEEPAHMSEQYNRL